MRFVFRSIVSLSTVDVCKIDLCTMKILFLLGEKNALRETFGCVEETV